MAFLTPEQKKSFGPVINIFGALLAVCFMIALASKYLMSGYPPAISFLEPFNEIVLTLGAALIGLVVYNNNKLVD
jgi:hypothetical protein